MTDPLVRPDDVAQIYDGRPYVFEDGEATIICCCSCGMGHVERYYPPTPGPTVCITYVHDDQTKAMRKAKQGSLLDGTDPKWVMITKKEYEKLLRYKENRHV